ncbi:hypothetical protein U1Q18_013380 [Sarracenia purpurea var. burkii]
MTLFLLSLAEASVFSGVGLAIFPGGSCRQILRRDRKIRRRCENYRARSTVQCGDGETEENQEQSLRIGIRQQIWGRAAKLGDAKDRRSLGYGGRRSAMREVEGDAKGRRSLGYGGCAGLTARIP